MKFIFFIPVLVFLISCSRSNDQEIISQTYVHKYGFRVSEKEWQEREQDGKVITRLRNGVAITTNFENGKQEGSTTISYPYSDIIHYDLVYDQDVLLKKITKDLFGIPIREEAYEFDDRVIITLWYDNGVPMSIEEYHKDLLQEATYFTQNNELEASIELGKGERIKRERNGTLVSKEVFENGVIACRSLYHPNGNLQSISNYENYQLHGEQKKFTVAGDLFLTQNWDKNILHGEKFIFKLGKKIMESPFHNGVKHGIERHYDVDGAIIAEIPWEHGKKHGKTRICTEDYSEIQWYFYNEPVTYTQFQDLQFREKMIAELSIEDSN